MSDGSIRSVQSCAGSVSALSLRGRGGRLLLLLLLLVRELSPCCSSGASSVK